MKIERTLERIDVKAFVVPVEFFLSECLFECTPLCVIWGDDPIGNVLLLEAFRDECDSLNLLYILKMQLT